MFNNFDANKSGCSSTSPRKFGILPRSGSLGRAFCGENKGIPIICINYRRLAYTCSHWIVFAGVFATYLQFSVTRYKISIGSYLVRKPYCFFVRQFVTLSIFSPMTLQLEGEYKNKTREVTIGYDLNMSG